jgi:hypothetical protein
MFKFMMQLTAATIALYVIGHMWAVSASPKCKGWSCDVVECHDGYAVRLPDGTYLPCEKFDQYVNGDKSVVVK